MFLVIIDVIIIVVILAVVVMFMIVIVVVFMVEVILSFLKFTAVCEHRKSVQIDDGLDIQRMNE